MLEICCWKLKERKLKFLSSDRGYEFSAYCKEHGIVHKKALYTPHKNRLAERKIWYMLIWWMLWFWNVRLPSSLCCEALLTASHMHIDQLLGIYILVYELWKERKPN